jgi:glucan phosphoethanolaminetransferase (alkaline phosphatase superfamily)
VLRLAAWRSVPPLLVVLTSLACGSQHPERSIDRVFLITVDTLRADHLSTYGYGRETSPRLDELARSGVLFERAIAQWPKTGASFASMFVGQYP